MVVILLLAASAAYLAFSQGTSSHSTTSSASSSTSSTASTSSPSTSNYTSSTTPSHSSTTSSTSVHSSTFVNKSQIQVIIPPGIENLANKVSFEPINITVVIGVNNTVFFTNKDDQEHILESTAWPQGGQPFQFYSLPGTGSTCVTTGPTPNCITLTTPGRYTYFCEWHPIWMDGEINVVASS